MKFKISALTAVALSGLMAVTSTVPAQAQNSLSWGQRDRVISTYCDRNPRDRDCRSYYGGRWSDRDYNRFYSRNRVGLDNIASGLFGFTFGAIIGGALANQNNGGYGDRVIGRADSSHVDRCYARYRSYDERTDTYLGYDGRRHLCNL
jgi:hypothetical protein